MARLRASQTQASHLRANRVIVAGLVLVAIGAVYGFTAITPSVIIKPASTTILPTSLPVTSALLACPAPGTGFPTGGGLALASSGDANGSGQAMLTELSPGGGSGAGTSAGTTVKVLTQPGQQLISRIPAAPKLPKSLTAVQQLAGGQVPTSMAGGGLIIQAVGALAQGLDAEQLGPDGKPTARCLTPGADFWYVTEASAKLHTQLYLLNTDSQPADVSVSVQTDAGPSVGVPDSGIVVPPYSMVTQDLSKLLRTGHAVSLNITTSSGRVVPAVRQTSDTTTEGTWLPVAQQPTLSQILPGLPGGSGTPVLYLSVPGNQPAQVQVTAITQHGTYQPTGGGGISLLSHVATGISLPSLAGMAAAIKVTSNVPVAAEMLVPGGPSGAPGVFLTGAAPISQQAVLAASPAGSAGLTQLVLSAPLGAATVSVVQAIAGQSLTGQPAQTVQIPAHSTKSVLFHLTKGQSSADTIVLTVTPRPGSGPVYAARVAEASGGPEGILPLVSTPVSVPLPPVRESLVEILK